MKNTLPLLFFVLLTLFSCSGDRPADGNSGDSIRDSIVDNDGIPDSVKTKFRKLVTAMPVPFEILNKFSGARMPFHGEFLNVAENGKNYSSGLMQAVNLGIYGADLAYMISQDKLADAAPYLKSIRILSDEIVIPTAFDADMMSRYEANKNRRDSMQWLVNTSYKRIDSTLQTNDRLIHATLVIYGGWIESMYLTVKHIGDQKQNEKNKVLFDMLTEQQPYFDNISELLSTFPDDSTCAWLYRDMLDQQKAFPSVNLTPEEFSKQLIILGGKLSATRNKLIVVQ